MGRQNSKVHTADKARLGRRAAATSETPQRKDSQQKVTAAGEQNGVKWNLRRNLAQNVGLFYDQFTGIFPGEMRTADNSGRGSRC